MEEDFEPKLEKKKTEEEIRQDVSQEVVTKEIPQEELKEYKNANKERKVGRIISRFIWTIIVLFVLFETVMGVLNMQRINDNKEPLWCFSKSEEKSNNKKEEKCNLGLYVIVKTVEGTETRISLKPFFLK